MNNARRRLYSNTQTKLEWEEALQQITRFFIILLSFFLFSQQAYYTQSPVGSMRVVRDERKGGRQLSDLKCSFS